MRTTAVFSLTLLALLLAACSPNTPVPGVRSVQLSPSAATLKPGESQEILAVVFGDTANKAVTWSSSDPAVVQVTSSGLVTGLKTGRATVTATSRADGGKSGSASVNVGPPEVSNVSLQPEALTLGVGGRRTLSALVEGTSGIDPGVSWASSDPAVATVSEGGEVTALAEGSASITATSVGDASKSATLPLSVVRIALEYAPVQATVGRAVERATLLTGGNAPFSFASEGTDLPAWLTLDPATGGLSGTPNAPSAAASYTVRVTDGDGGTATAALSLTVNPLPVLAYPASNTLTAGSSASLFPTTDAGGTGSKTYAISPAALPAGLSFNPGTGAISGTPTTVRAASSYTVTATDANGATASSNPFSLAVGSSLGLTYAATRALTVGRPVAEGAGGNYTRAVSGAVGAVSYSITSPAPPAWLSISPATGVLSGTPTAAGSFPITVRVSDGSAAAVSSSLTLVANAAPTLAFAQTRALTAGQAVATANYTLTPALGTAPYAYASADIGPTGLALSASGVISGTPSAAAVTAGTLTFNLTVTDANGAATTATPVTFTVNPAPTLAYPAVNVRTVGTPATIGPTTNAGGTGSKTYALASGTLPAGLSLSPTTGVISGTPTAATLAPASVSVSATDANTAAVTSTAFTISVNLPATP